jgi:enterobactin synthetase component F
MIQDRSDAIWPLTTAQRGLWMGTQLAPPGATFNIAEAVEITGEIEPDLFVRALTQISAEAETTRIRIIMTADGPMQQVVPSVRAEFPVVDMTAEADPEGAAHIWMRAHIMKRVDLEHDPLWIGALIKLDAKRFMWFQCCHHIALDGFSAGMLAARLAALYTAFVEGREPEPHGFLPIATLLEQEQSYRASERRETDRRYWLEQLHEAPEAPTLSVRLDRRKNGTDGGFIRRSWTIPPETVERLTSLVRSHGATLPQGLTAILAGYLFRITGQQDFVLGMPFTGRATRILRQVPGLAANVVTLRFRPTRHASFIDLLKQSRRAIQGALRHQQFRYEDLRRDLGFYEMDQHLARFSVNIEPFDYALRFAGAPTRSHNLSNGAMEDLTVFVFDRQDGKGLRVDFDANPSLYMPSELDEHLGRVERLITGLIEDPEAAIGAHDLMDGEERLRRVRQAEDVVRCWPAKDVAALVRDNSLVRPDAVAVIDSVGALSYEGLAADTEWLRGRLVEAGIGAGHLVAVMLPRDRRAVTALLAIAESGAAWLPIDGDGPVERVHAILEDAQPALLITDEQSDMEIPAALPRLVLGGSAGEATLQGSVDRLANSVPRGTAYVTYTSGTTGRPKGVVVSHRSLTNLLLSMREILEFGPRERLLAVTTLTFDIAVLEMLLPLVSAATVVIATREERRDPRLLAAAISRHGVTALQATPTLWQALLGAGEGEALSGLLLLTGGEALPPQLAERLFHLGRALFNLYGPTETTIWSTARRITEGDLTLPPIGYPIANTRLHILDPYGVELPDGVVGELAIAGDGVATGYLGQPRLTAERFPQDIFSGESGARLYRTGDRAVRDAQGLVSTLGRCDDQVKIKGVRVEPAEIESALLRQSGIAQAAVVVERTADTATPSARLVAYLVAGDGAARMDSASLRRSLSTMLLPQMIPSWFHYLDALPRTPNGKLDRRALPRPEAEVLVGQASAHVSPQTPTEQMLAEVWKTVLGVEDIGIHDNFFDLGGDSLSAVQLITALTEKGADLSLGNLFSVPTIAGLVPLFDGAAHAPNSLGELLPIRTAGDAAPIFCIHPVLGVGWSFATLAPHLPQRHPIYALQDAGMFMNDAAPSSMEALINSYLHQIRSVQSSGPYHLIGWSMGGLIAHGLASRLREEGETVALLALLDSYPFLGTVAAPEDMEEAVLIRATMDFLKLEPSEEKGMPDSIDALAERIAEVADLSALPATLGSEFGSIPDFIARLREVTLQNLNLARRYRLGHADADALFLRAASRGGDGADAIVHDTPEVWRSHLGGNLVIHDVDCRHQDMLLPVHAAQLGGIITGYLNAMRSDCDAVDRVSA